MPSRPTAVAVLITHRAALLLIRRAEQLPMGGYWTPVTGKVEVGERLEEACVREAQEEVGLAITVQERFCDSETHTGAYRLIYYTATCADPTLTLDPREVGAARWGEPAELLALSPMLPQTRAVLQAYVASRAPSH